MWKCYVQIEFAARSSISETIDEESLTLPLIILDRTLTSSTVVAVLTAS